MCTVSFVSSNDKIILTSNRDETVLRPAIPPQWYVVNGKEILFPKDTKAGGTWFASDKKANTIVLLNGAAEKHKHLFTYRKSRGIIVLDLIGSESPIKSWHEIDLNSVEPFTIVLFEHQKLYQLRWNGFEKETVSLETNKKYVWSSSTLYPNDIRQQRSNWFYSFLETKPNVTEAEMFHFHRYTEEGNSENGLVINRNENLQTLSITQLVLDAKTAQMKHCDLQQRREFSTHFFVI